MALGALLALIWSIVQRGMSWAMSTPRYTYLRGWGGTGRGNGRFDGPPGFS